MEPQYPLAVIIVSYKNEDMSIRFVKEQVSKITTPHKIIIVNNAATSESNQKYASALDADVVGNPSTNKINPNSHIFVLNNPVNSGFAIGNNLGAKFVHKHFHSTYLLFSNNDIRFKNDNVVEELMHKLESHQEVGIIGPMVRGLNGDYQSPEPYMSFADRFIWIYLSTPFLSKERKRSRFNMDYAEKAREGYHYRVMGSFFMVPAKAYFECGMMDEHTFLYAEEMILSERMLSIGKKTYYDPEVCVIHVHGATIKKSIPSRKMMNIQFNSNAYYYHHYKKVSKLEIAFGKLVNNILYFIKS